MAVFTSKINDGYSAHLEVTQGSQNIGGNSSTVNYKLYVTKASNYTGRYSPYTGRAYSVVVNGTTVENGTWTYDFRGKDSLTVVSGSTTVPHNSDGKKTVSASGSVYIFDVGTGKPSGSLTLTAIPRASTLTSFSNFTTDSANISFGLDKKYSGYTHDVVLKFGTTNIKTWTGQSLGATGNSVRTLALDGNDRAKLLARMPSTTSGSVTLVVTTKNGTTTLGTSQRTATVSVDSSRVPTITNISVVTQTKAGRISGTTATYVVQNVGTIRCSYTATAGHSSSIKSAVIKANGSTFNSRDQTWIPGTAGSNTITIEVTDARGRVARATRTVTVLNYQPISATLSSLTRRSDNKLSAVTQVSNAPIKNGTTNMGRYRVTIYTTPTDKSAGRSNVYTKNHTGVGHTNNAETHIPTTIYDDLKSYDAEVVVEDDYSMVSLRGTLPTASYPFVMGKYGVGAGKIPEGNRVLDVGGQIWDHSNNVSRNLSATVDALDDASLNGVVKYHGGSTTYDADTTLITSGLLRLTSTSPPSGDGFYYFEQAFYGSISATANRLQRATHYTLGLSWERHYYNGSWSMWKGVTGVRTAFLTMRNNWGTHNVSFGNPHILVQGHLVTFTGLVAGGASMASQSEIARIQDPDLYPRHNVVFTCAAGNSSGFVKLKVSPSGVVSFEGAVGGQDSTSWIALDGISYMCTT